MTEYITKEQAQKEVENIIAPYIPTLIGSYEKIPLDLARAIENVPAADVAPVIHAKWKAYCYQNYICSNCENIIPDSDTKEYKYCPQCGAKMDKE